MELTAAEIRYMRNLINESVDKAMYYRTKALASEAKANARGAKILTDARREFGPRGKILPKGTTVEDVADDRTGKDPVWKSHAGDNRWHLDQAMVESNTALMLMKALEMGISLS